MLGLLLVHPVWLLPRHPLPTRNDSTTARFIERAGLRPVAERLRAVSLLARFPLIDDHFDGHAATPYASGAFRIVGP